MTWMAQWKIIERKRRALCRENLQNRSQLYNFWLCFSFSKKMGFETVCYNDDSQPPWNLNDNIIEPLHEISKNLTFSQV